MRTVDIRATVGGGYDDFWTFRGRYRVVKGGRGSKKSTTTALWIIYEMMRYWAQYRLKPCVLVLRRFADTNRDSTFAQLLWAIDRLGVGHLWKSTKSPLELTYSPSGQKILFRGLDKPQSINSIVVKDGVICWTWFEEAFQVADEDAFNKIDLSIRGEVDTPLFKMHTLTLNPWSDKCWIKARFYDAPAPDVLAITRNYDVNEFLSADDLALFERMRIENPRRYAIEGRGEWGISEGLIFDRWHVESFNPEIVAREIDRATMRPKYRALFGLDFGFSNDPTAFVYLLADERHRRIYVCFEIYGTGILLDRLARLIKEAGCARSEIVADSASPQMIAELRARGIPNIKPSKKGAGSIEAGIKRLQDFEIIINESCPNVIVEFSNYAWKKDAAGTQMAKPIDEYNHAIDAMRYATEGISERTFGW
jgi:phage terminase large subunit